MKKIKVIAGIMLIQLLFINVSCAQEHQGERHGEEDGTQFTKSQTYNQVKKGVHLILKYDEERESFIGTIENTSKKTVERARVEVHLSNGVELGPTKPKDVKAGETINVSLSAKGQNFKTWSTHAEVGSNEHGHGAGGESHEEGREHIGKKEGSGEHK